MDTPQQILQNNILYEPTGEYRIPAVGEYFHSAVAEVILDVPNYKPTNPRLIYRRVEPKPAEQSVKVGDVFQFICPADDPFIIREILEDGEFRIESAKYAVNGTGIREIGESAKRLPAMPVEVGQVWKIDGVLCVVKRIESNTVYFQKNTYPEGRLCSYPIKTFTNELSFHGWVRGERAEPPRETFGDLVTGIPQTYAGQTREACIAELVEQAANLEAERDKLFHENARLKEKQGFDWVSRCIEIDKENTRLEKVNESYADVIRGLSADIVSKDYAIKQALIAAGTVAQERDEARARVTELEKALDYMAHNFMCSFIPGILSPVFNDANIPDKLKEYYINWAKRGY